MSSPLIGQRASSIVKHSNRRWTLLRQSSQCWSQWISSTFSTGSEFDDRCSSGSDCFCASDYAAACSGCPYTNLSGASNGSLDGTIDVSCGGAPIESSFALGFSATTIARAACISLEPREEADSSEPSQGPIAGQAIS